MAIVYENTVKSNTDMLLDSNMQKNETGPLSYTIHKNKLKMNEIPKC